MITTEVLINLFYSKCYRLQYVMIASIHLFMFDQFAPIGWDGVIMLLDFLFCTLC